MIATIFCDGGARPTNPGHAAYGFTIDLDGVRKASYGGFINHWRTNNYAEFYSLRVAVGNVCGYPERPNQLEIYSDSTLLVNCLNGKWECREPTLKAILDDIHRALASQFMWEGVNWTAHWIPREENTEADKLCTRALLKGIKQFRRQSEFRKKLKRMKK